MSIRSKKILLAFLCITLALILLFILCVSPLTKYLIEKYSEKYTGRCITLEKAYINPFTGYVHFKDLRIFESKKTRAASPGDSVFLLSNGLSAHFSLLKMVRGNYEFSDVLLDKPVGEFILNNKEFSLNDVIQLFSPKEKDNKKADPVHFSILNIEIDEGEFHYREKGTPINFFIQKVRLKSPGIQWNNEEITGKIQFVSDIGTGSIAAGFSINTRSLRYRFDVVAQRYDLKFIAQYLKELMNYGSFNGKVDSDISVRGSFKEGKDIKLFGLLSFEDVHLGKEPGDDYAAFGKVVFRMKNFSPKEHTYIFDSVSLVYPYSKYERYDSTDNIQTMFGANGATISTVQSNKERFNLVIEIARYIKLLVNDFFKSYYKIGRLALYHGKLQYNDFSLAEKFSMSLNPVFLYADSVDKNRSHAQLLLMSGLDPYGDIRICLGTNPRDSANFDLDYHLNQLSLSQFNPYLITYSSYPLRGGSLTLHGSWKVRNGSIQSNNHLLIDKPSLARRIKNEGVHKLPMPLIMALLVENGNFIDYEIPITGNLHHPKFHLKDILIHVLENIFVKPPAVSYHFLVKKIETKREETVPLQWETGRSLLDPKQTKYIHRLAALLAKNPKASLQIYPEEYVEREKESLLFFEAKKNYFLFSKGKGNVNVSKADSEKIEKMSERDPFFTAYLNKYASGPLQFTLQEKCTRLIGMETIETSYLQLKEAREKVLRSYLKKRGVEERLRIAPVHSGIPFDGFSYYKINYVTAK